jgi:hypothetical protein
MTGLSSRPATIPPGAGPAFIQKFPLAKFVSFCEADSLN